VHLEGKRIAFLAADGVEQVELTDPWQAVKSHGANPELISLKKGAIQGVKGMDRGDRFDVNATVADADPDAYDALVLPGGVKNPDLLRQNPAAVEFVRAFITAGKPVGAICHGPWMLVETGAVRGRTVTSYPSLRTDIRNAGGEWVDEEVHVDRGIVTSRTPDDLPAFNAKLIEEIAEGSHLRPTTLVGAQR
jgi:protease I